MDTINNIKDYYKESLCLKIEEVNKLQPKIRINIDGKEKQLLFDTGFDELLDIGENIWNLEEKEQVNSTFYGDVKSRYVTPDSILINGIRFKNNPPIGVFNDKAMFSKLMGMQFVVQFDKVIIDNTNKRILFLERKKNTKENAKGTTVEKHKL